MKNLVFLSLAYNQLILDLCFQMASFLSSQQLNSTRVSLTTLFTISEAGSNSRLSNFFYKLAIFFPTWSNSSLFQVWSLCLHTSVHLWKGEPVTAAKPSLQASFTTLSYLWSFNHIDSNRNNLFCFCLFTFRVKCSKIRQWSEAEEDRWYSFKDGNMDIQLGIANALSNHSLICKPSQDWDNWVKCGPI